MPYNYINIYVWYIHLYIYTYTCNHENNVPSRLSPQWICGNSCTWYISIYLYIYIYISIYISISISISIYIYIYTIVVITGRAHCLFSWLRIYYAHLAFVRFQHYIIYKEYKETRRIYLNQTLIYVFRKIYIT